MASSRPLLGTSTTAAAANEGKEGEDVEPRPPPRHPVDYRFLCANLAFASLAHGVCLPPRYQTTLELFRLHTLVLTASVALLLRPSVGILALFLASKVAFYWDLLPAVPNHVVAELNGCFWMLLTLLRVCAGRWLRGRCPRTRAPRSILGAPKSPGEPPEPLAAPPTPSEEARWADEEADEEVSLEEEVLCRVRRLLLPLLVALYAFAVVHKLNRDYLKPEVNCALWIYGLMRQKSAPLPVLGLSALVPPSRRLS